MTGSAAASTSPGSSPPRRSRPPARRSPSTWRSTGRRGAERVAAIATSAVRDASNGDAFVAELRERFALSARVLDGEEEARLTYLGATAEQLPDRADPGHRHRRRLDRADRRHRRRDRLPRLAAGRASSATPSATSPPTRRPRPSSRRSPATCAALIEDAARRPRRGPRRAPASPSPAPRPRWPRSSWASSPTTPSASTATSSPFASIQRLLSQLASAPLAERREIPGLHPDRAPTIVAGVVILIEAMRAFGLERIEVSEHDILYGVAIAAASPDADNPPERRGNSWTQCTASFGDPSRWVKRGRRTPKVGRSLSTELFSSRKSRHLDASG